MSRENSTPEDFFEIMQYHVAAIRRDYGCDIEIVPGTTSIRLGDSVEEFWGYDHARQFCRGVAAVLCPPRALLCAVVKQEAALCPGGGRDLRPNYSGVKWPEPFPIEAKPRVKQ